MKKNIGKRLKDTKAITLIALVITIIVLLILAGVALSSVLSQDGIFNKAESAAIITKIAELEEKARIIYYEKRMDQTENDPTGKVTIEDIIGELEKEKYQIEQIHENGIVDITLEKEKIEMSLNDSKQIEVTLVSGESGNYYLILDGKYYRISFQNDVFYVDKQPSNITNQDEEALEWTASVLNNRVSVSKTSDSTLSISSSETRGEDEIVISCNSVTKKCFVSVATTMKDVSGESIVGTYFSYPQKSAEPLLCVGVAQAEGEYGAEIMPINPVGTLSIGHATVGGSAYTTLQEWNQYIELLSAKIEPFFNDSVSNSFRCLGTLRDGSNPGEAVMPTEINKLNDLGINIIPSGTMLGAKWTLSSGNATEYKIGRYVSSGGAQESNLCVIRGAGRADSASVFENQPIMGIFDVKNECKIASGLGSKEEPFVIIAPQ